MIYNKSGVIFLGVSEKATYTREGNTNLYKWNIIGLKHTILSNIYPLPFNGWVLGLAIHSKRSFGNMELHIKEKDGKIIGKIMASLEKTVPLEHGEISAPGEISAMPVFDVGWTPLFLPLGETSILIEKPGQYFLSIDDEVIGSLEFLVIDPPPLTAERIAGIKSDPTAIKAVRMGFTCNKCQAKIKAYAALEKNLKLEKEGYIADNFLPNEFLCKCGHVRLDLRLIKKNLHGFLGSRSQVSSNVNLMPLYEKSSLVHIREGFKYLLAQDPREEEIQKFIESHPILLHQFPAIEIFFKPPILTSFIADFGIITPQKELILVEIEKTTTRLMKKNGGSSAELNHAIDQVRDWLYLIDEHRLAVLEEIGIEHNKVSVVRGVVIAGRDLGCDVKHLRRLKGADRGRIRFLTYDDLLSALDALIENIETA